MFSIFLTKGSTMLCYGENDDGQLGLGHNNSVDGFVENSFCPQFIAFSSGGKFNAGICVDGHLWTCGNNDFGQLGLGHNKSINKFAPVLSDEQFISVSCGYSYMIALDDNGTIWICGDIGYHKYEKDQTFDLVNYTVITPNDKRHIFPNLIKVESDQKFISINADMCSFCAIDDKNNLWGCGENDFGQFGPQIKEKNVTNLLKLSNDQFKQIICSDCNIGGVKIDGNLTGFSHQTLPHPIDLTKLENVPINLTDFKSDSTLGVGLDENGNLWSYGGGLCENFQNYDTMNKKFVAFDLIVGADWKYYVFALDTEGILWLFKNEHIYEYTYAPQTENINPDQRQIIATNLKAVKLIMRPIIEDVKLIQSKISQAKRVKSAKS